jgi:hypothetical protein
VPTLWAEQGLTAALIMLVVLLVYQQVENNVLTPKIQGKAVQLSGFFIIVAVTLFAALLGVLGALTAVPLAATIQIFVGYGPRARSKRRARLSSARLDSLIGPRPSAGWLFARGALGQQLGRVQDVMAGTRSAVIAGCVESHSRCRRQRHR